MKFQRWNLRKTDESAVRALKDAGYPYLVCTVLASRGVCDAHAAALDLLAYDLGSSVMGSLGGWFWSAGGWPAVAGFVAALLALRASAPPPHERLPNERPSADRIAIDRPSPHNQICGFERLGLLRLPGEGFRLRQPCRGDGHLGR